MWSISHVRMGLFVVSYLGFVPEKIESLCIFLVLSVRKATVSLFHPHNVRKLCRSLWQALDVLELKATSSN